MSSLVVGVKLIDGKGKKRSFGADDQEMAAVRACLGLCGIIYEISFQVRSMSQCVEKETLMLSMQNGNGFYCILVHFNM